MSVVVSLLRGLLGAPQKLGSTFVLALVLFIARHWERIKQYLRRRLLEDDICDGRSDFEMVQVLQEVFPMNAIRNFQCSFQGRTHFPIRGNG